VDCTWLHCPKKGYLINWAKATEFTTKEKAHKDKVKGAQLGTMKRETIDNGGIMKIM